MCPGTLAGTFDEENHIFVNQHYGMILPALQDVLKMFKQINPSLRVILTVSPVPLTATNSGKHVLVATMQSKSTLRAIAGYVSDVRKFVDYFPSYEIINSAPFKGMFFEHNERSVSPHGVNHVMRQFCVGLQRLSGNSPEQIIASQNSEMKPPVDTGGNDDLVCEEELLGAFGQN
jgi:hypothetical protein